MKILVMVLLVHSFPALAEELNAYEAFVAEKCVYTGPVINQVLGKNVYAAHDALTLPGDGDTFIQAGTPFVVKTQHTKIEKAGKAPFMALERTGKQTVKLINGFSSTVYVFEETPKCQKAHDKLVKALKQ